MYTAYVLTKEARDLLKQKFPPKYSKFIGEHVTIDFGVPLETSKPEEAKLNVIGYKDSGDGLEALVVSVNGNKERPDGNIYHITWSLEPDKYSPKDSNELIKNLVKKWKMVMPIEIDTIPKIVL